MTRAGFALRGHARPLRLAGCAAASAGLVLALTAAAPLGAAHLVTKDTGALIDVSADSPHDAWAVGSAGLHGGAGAMALHWNGTSWTQVPLPDARIHFEGVTALSPDEAWAVGARPGKPGANTLVLHWNGTSWERVPSPSPHPGHGSNLESVSADSPSDAWAVGTAAANPPEDAVTLALHWNGTSWKLVPTPSPARNGSLDSVSADSPSDAWAVGLYSPGNKLESLALHWNGVSWRRVPIPVPDSSSENVLDSVTAVSRTDAWAVGYYGVGLNFKAEVLHWNGTSWKQASIPKLGTNYSMDAVSAASPTDVWAVGSTASANLMLHWNGTEWSKVASPALPHAASLSAVSTVSGSDAWAAGCVCTYAKDEHTLLLHWDGTSWARS